LSIWTSGNFCVSNSRSREPLVKGKDEYGCPPCIYKFRSAALMRRSTVLSHPFQLVFPSPSHIFLIVENLTSFSNLVADVLHSPRTSLSFSLLSLSLSLSSPSSLSSFSLSLTSLNPSLVSSLDQNFPSFSVSLLPMLYYCYTVCFDYSDSRRHGQLQKSQLPKTWRTFWSFYVWVDVLASWPFLLVYSLLLKCLTVKDTKRNCQLTKSQFAKNVIQNVLSILWLGWLCGKLTF